MARSRREEFLYGERQGMAEVGVGPSEPESTPTDPGLGQSAESEVAMDTYGSQENTAREVIRAAQTDEDPEPGAPSLEKLTPPPPLPKETKLAEPDIVPPTVRPAPPQNPPPPTPEFITEEVRTFKPIYLSLIHI